MGYGVGPTFLQIIDQAIQTGRGAAASVLGQTYDVRRLSPTTNVSISQNVPVISQFDSRSRRIVQKVAIENQIFDLIVFNMTCDNTSLELGDVLNETGYEAESGDIFTIASFRPTRETLAVRTESNISISRPNPSAGQAGQQPAAGAVATEGYGGVWKANEKNLVLINGLYAFSTESGATPATVWCGLQPTSRMRDASSPKFPFTEYRTEYLIYCPLLPGEQINPLDRFNFGGSDRYEVGIVYTSETTGLSGYICKCEKINV